MPELTKQAILADILSRNLSRSHWSQKATMSRYTTLHLGGPADFFVKIGSEDDLRLCLSAAAENEIPVTVLGNGSNVLVSDLGIRGLVLQIGEAFSKISVLPEKNAIDAQSGAALQKLCNVAAAQAYSGMEFASGIPGTLGGAIYMNAGAFGGEMKNIVSSVRVMDNTGRISRLTNEELAFSYRHSILMDTLSPLVLLSATLTFVPGDEEVIRLAMKGFVLKRKEKQPLQLPSCGSTFKRPEGNFAGTLIEQCGLKGFRVGGCSVSTQHAGFLVNDQNGTTDDYLELIRLVQEKVYRETGVTLESEVRFVGEKHPSMI